MTVAELIAKLSPEQQRRLVALGWSWQGDVMRHTDGSCVWATDAGAIRGRGPLVSPSSPSFVPVFEAEDPLVAACRTRSIMLVRIEGSTCYTPLTGHEYQVTRCHGDGVDFHTGRYLSYAEAAIDAMGR